MASKRKTGHRSGDRVGVVPAEGAIDRPWDPVRMETMRIGVRVQTRAQSDFVGGRYGSADPPVLVVRVRAAPTTGQANAACVAALAKAFGVSRKAVSIVAGARGRSKLVDVQGADPLRLKSLLERSA